MAEDDEKIRDLCGRLRALLDDPHPGLFTWVEMRNSVAKELHTALEAKLPLEEQAPHRR